MYNLNITSPQSESYNRIYRFFTPSEHLLTDQGLSPPPAAIKDDNRGIIQSGFVWNISSGFLNILQFDFQPKD